MDLTKIYKNRIGDSEAFVRLSSGIVAVVHGAVPMLKDGSELFSATTPGHVQGTLTATVDTINEVTNIPSVDLIDEVTNISSVDLVDLITRIAEVTLVGQVSEVTSVPAAIQGPGNPVVDSFASAVITLSADTLNQSIIAAPGANKQLWIYEIVVTANTGDGTLRFEDGDGTALSGAIPVAENGGFASAASGNFAMPTFKVPTNKAFRADTVTLGAAGWCTYAVVDVS
jgi:hypothetical protein